MSRLLVPILSTSLLLSTAPSSTVWAQEVAAATDEEARSLFEAGQSAFGAGNYERALEYLERAYALSHRSGLLYNIAITADRVRNDARALEAFRAYLAEEPQTERRAEVEARIAYLERAMQGGATEEAAPDDAAPDAAPDDAAVERGPDTTGSIALLVSGGVVLVVGGVLLGVAATEQALVDGAMPGTAWREYAGHHEAAEALAISGGVSLGVGAILAIVGAIVWPSGSSEPRAAMRLDARGWEVSF